MAMNLADQSLKALIEISRFPTAILNESLEMVAANESFNYKFDYNSESKKLRIHDIDYLKHVENPYINIAQRIELSAVQEPLRVGKFVLQVCALKNSEQQVSGWILTIGQHPLINETNNILHAKLEDKLHQQLEIAHEAKINSIVEIASALAHEINQPVAAISTFTQGCVEQIEAGTYTPDNILYALKECVRQAERTGQIIHRIKNSVRKKSLYLEITKINSVIEESIKFIQYEKKQNIPIIYNSCQFIQQIYVDKIQIQQVIINLLLNSVEALEDGCTLEPKIIISCFCETAGELKLQVLDNGPGFPLEILENRLESYISSKSGGMG
ncbi:MAG: sensor histidine kinase, partial [Gammaproteobacteria bacterium]